MKKAAFLYLVPSDEPSHKLETAPGLKCFLEDLSDTGCAITVGGKAAEGLRVKVQFALNNIPVCITGSVRSTNYREDANRTVLRIEAEPLPREIKNYILSEVFGMLPDEDELPFRVMDDEMANLTVGGNRADDDRAGDDRADDGADSVQTDSIFLPDSDEVVSADMTATMRKADGA